MKMMLAENERMLQRIVGEFDRVCNRKLKVNVLKGKVMYMKRRVTRPLILQSHGARAECSTVKSGQGRWRKCLNLRKYGGMEGKSSVAQTSNGEMKSYGNKV